MKVRVWTYVVPAEAAADFEREYGSGGAWAELFSRADGYLGTQLFRAVQAPDQYLTLDRFVDDRAWRSFLTAYGGEYAQLDARLARLTLSQEEVV